MINSYVYTHTVETDVSPAVIWALYEDVTTWPGWDAQAELITRDGPFEAGTTGTMKFVGQEPLPYRLAKGGAAARIRRRDTRRCTRREGQPPPHAATGRTLTD